MKISSLIAKAQSNLEKGQRAEPKGDNALEDYQAVLLLAPENEKALRGLESLSDVYVDAAVETNAQGQLDEALTQIDWALEANPNNVRAGDLKFVIQEKLKRERAITLAMKSAERYSDLGQFYGPTGG